MCDELVIISKPQIIPEQGNFTMRDFKELDRQVGSSRLRGSASTGLVVAHHSLDQSEGREFVKEGWTPDRQTELYMNCIKNNQELDKLSKIVRFYTFATFCTKLCLFPVDRCFKVVHGLWKYKDDNIISGLSTLG